VQYYYYFVKFLRYSSQKYDFLSISAGLQQKTFIKVNTIIRHSIKRLNEKAIDKLNALKTKQKAEHYSGYR